MSLIVKLIISLVIATIAAVLTSIMLNGEIINLVLLLAFFVATAATALIVRDASPQTSGSTERVARKPASSNSQTDTDTNREHGTVKWFNVSKGFGFIVRDNGDEIFVHFRSIRGEGRRGLRDGQNVSYIVTDSDKGPQAEDVQGEP